MPGLHIDNGAKIVTGDALKPHVQDALDEIEYITGNTSTTWGARRAKDGHPQPFKLRYVEVGNEDWLNMGTASYDERFTMFYDAIKAKYPDSRSSRRCDRRTGISFIRRKPDLLDDHFYIYDSDGARAGASVRQLRPQRDEDLCRRMGDEQSAGRGHADDGFRARRCGVAHGP